MRRQKRPPQQLSCQENISSEALLRRRKGAVAYTHSVAWLVRREVDRVEEDFVLGGRLHGGVVLLLSSGVCIIHSLDVVDHILGRVGGAWRRVAADAADAADANLDVEGRPACRRLRGHNALPGARCHSRQVTGQLIAACRHALLERRRRLSLPTSLMRAIVEARLWGRGRSRMYVGRAGEGRDRGCGAHDAKRGPDQKIPVHGALLQIIHVPT